MAFAFTAFVPKYRCKIPLCDFPEFARYNDPRTGEAFTFVKTAIGSMGDGKKTLGMIHSIDLNGNLNLNKMMMVFVDSSLHWCYSYF